ncbi:T6SS immunity protein Tli4 family protein [Dyella subtropica]|uniref:T6SS immunity protein Tli4 family protein n=1 Tax=Dyella subtropica TaxID=2992127 RepID=UPI00224F9E33|nr:T6SS immunity protein Tli4 family protein [Dyella subtropica]
MNKVSSICFGRFVIDLPEGSQIRELGQQSEFMFGPIESERTEIDAKGFSERMSQRESEIKTKKLKHIYQLTKTISPSSDTQIFLASRDAFGSLGYGFDAHRLDKNVLFSMTQTGFDPENIDSVVSSLQHDLLPHLRARQQDEIPSDPGFCIKDGFVANDGKDSPFEEARVQINLKEWPDLWVSVYSQTVSKAGDKTLIQRVDNNPLPAELASIAGKMRTLRKGKHSVGSLAGEEVLDVLPTEEGFKIHDFTWEALGAVHDSFKPTLHLEFSSGNGQGGGSHVQPTLTDDQAIKLFDSIVNSIRLRPTGPAKVSSAEPTPSSPQAPLGAAISAGKQ